MSMGKLELRYRKLLKLASQNGGVFSSAQAEICGFAKNNHGEKIKSGVWERVGHGLYRFADDLETVGMTPVGAALLWTRSYTEAGRIMGAVSHGTALAAWNICDYTTPQIHITVPNDFRRSRIPEGVTLHYSEIEDDDVISSKYFSKITTPWRTLKDCYESQVVTTEFVIDAFMRARASFLISYDDISFRTNGLSDEGAKFFMDLEERYANKKSYV